MGKKWFIVLPLLIILSTAVLGIGIGSRDLSEEVYFSPNKELSFDYQVITTSNQVMDYLPFAIMEEAFYGREPEVDLAPYVYFEPAVLKTISPGSNPMFRARLRFPEKISMPGVHTMRICVEETMASGGMVGSKSSACARITIIVQYPGKYLVSGLHAADTNINQATRFELNTENRGEQKIEQLWGVINIHAPGGSLINSVYTEKVSLAPQESKKLSAVLDTFNYKPGEYLAKATIFWDGEVWEINDTFRVGSLELKVINYTSEFEPDQINPFQIILKSGWNSELKDVYAVIKLPNGEIQTPTTTLQPWEDRQLTTYWETKGLAHGEYSAVMTIYFAGQSASENIRLTVKGKTEEMTAPVEDKKIEMSLPMLIFAGVALLVSWNMILWIIVRKRKDG